VKGWLKQLGWALSGATLGVLFWISPLNPFPSPNSAPADSQNNSQNKSQNGPHKVITVQDLFKETRGATIRIEQSSSALHLEPDSIGTGFIISKDGLVLTAYHVIFQAAKLTALTPNRKRYPLKVVGFDSAADLALLKMDTNQSQPYLTLSSRPPKMGEYVMAIGNSRDQFLQPRSGKLLRQGVKSARADFPQNTFELDAPIGPGDSGGPIIDGDGHALGVVSYIRVDSAGALINGYAIPISQDSTLIRDLQAGAQRDVPVIGFKVVSYPLSSSERQTRGIADGAGVVVEDVTPGGPAEQAGLRNYDLITQIDGEALQDYDDLVKIVRSHRVGDTITLTLIRNQMALEFKVVLQARAKVFARG
jgi:serine protease Do